jgi:uncharacterized protein YcbX
VNTPAPGGSRLAGRRPDCARISALYRYPLKSARGQALQEARLGSTGFEHDRQWMLVTPQGRFISQREQPRLALLQAEATAARLRLYAADLPPLSIAPRDAQRHMRVSIWRDECLALDAGDEIAARLSDWLHSPCRLVRFDLQQQRLSNRQYTGDIAAENAFSDGYPLLLTGAASLAELNQRIGRELPINRFRPNIVLAGLDPYDEDHLQELHCGGLVLRAVKPCTRCSITATEQASGTLDGDEPLRTLRTYRYDAGLGGVTFGQNLIIVKGRGALLRVGETLQLRWRKI